jgi:hypothetical protein
MTSLARADDLGLKVASAIGLPVEHLTGFSLHFTAGELVKLNANYMVPVDGENCLGMVLADYSLVPKEAA